MSSTNREGDDGTGAGGGKQQKPELFPKDISPAGAAKLRSICCERWLSDSTLAPPAFESMLNSVATTDVPSSPVDMSRAELASFMQKMLCSEVRRRLIQSTSNELPPEDVHPSQKYITYKIQNVHRQIMAKFRNHGACGAWPMWSQQMLCSPSIVEAFKKQDRMQVLQEVKHIILTGLRDSAGDASGPGRKIKPAMKDKELSQSRQISAQAVRERSVESGSRSLDFHAPAPQKALRTGGAAAVDAHQVPPQLLPFVQCPLSVWNPSTARLFRPDSLAQTAPTHISVDSVRHRYPASYDCLRSRPAVDLIEGKDYQVMDRQSMKDAGTALDLCHELLRSENGFFIMDGLALWPDGAPDFEEWNQRFHTVMSKIPVAACRRNGRLQFAPLFATFPTHPGEKNVPDHSRSWMSWSTLNLLQEGTAVPGGSKGKPKFDADDANTTRLFHSWATNIYKFVHRNLPFEAYRAASHMPGDDLALIHRKCLPALVETEHQDPHMDRPGEGGFAWAPLGPSNREQSLLVWKGSARACRAAWQLRNHVETMRHYWEQHVRDAQDHSRSDEDNFNIFWDSFVNMQLLHGGIPPSEWVKCRIRVRPGKVLVTSPFLVHAGDATACMLSNIDDVMLCMQIQLTSSDAANDAAVDLRCNDTFAPLFHYFNIPAPSDPSQWYLASPQVARKRRELRDRSVEGLSDNPSQIGSTPEEGAHGKRKCKDATREGEKVDRVVPFIFLRSACDMAVMWL